MAHSTLLGWANSVRMTMANDTGRELFQEQVQTHGFSFLDNYLNDILSGAKQDPLIELVKTPGRKKAVSQKLKFATKLAQVGTKPVEGLNKYSTEDQRNSPVVNDFTQALLSAKQGSEVVSSPKTSQTIVSTGVAPLDCPSPKQGHASAPTHNQPELSVIAEDDEAIDLSRLSTKGAADPPPPVGTQIQASTTEIVVQSLPQDEMYSDRGERTDLGLPTNVSPVPLTIPAESTLKDHSIKVKEGFASTDIVVPLHDVEVLPVSPKSISHKGVLPTLPTLPEPIPLRKSMRSAKELSFGNVMLGAATPGNAGAGKRTSWLMKAREVKAMEGIPKKLAITPTPTTATVFSGVKRRSDETIDPSDPGDEERLWKAMKTKKEETVPAKIASPKLPVAKPEASTETLERRSKDEILDLLKKTVQSFEARIDKPSNKVSGNTAIALAEARAQAEARIAERNHNSATGNDGSTTTVSEPEAPVMAISSKKLEPSYRVNDLFPSDGKVKDKSKSPGKNLPSPFYTQASMPKLSDLQQAGKHESTSTTPPQSPPSQLSQTIPVFNKPSPVFVPPVSSSTRPLPTPPSFPEASFNFPSLPAFTKPASMTRGISPRLLSPVVNPTTALSTQPTVDSIQPDNLFGDRGNTEAWVPSTQDTEYSSAFGSQQVAFGQQNVLDDDDSWPLDTKSSQGVHWPFSGFTKEDSMTWSTHSQNYDATLHSKGSGRHEEIQSPEMKDTPLLPGGLAEGKDIKLEYHSTAVRQKSELDELPASKTAPPEPDADHGLSSSTTTASLQSQVGLFSQASKLVWSIGKKESEAKKTTQLAGVAAKKLQEDDKKVARLKELENRRQIAMQRKAEEERTRQQEQERKVKDDTERKKRERDEQGEKKSLKSATAGASLKKDEETTKKRKLEQERPEKKQELKKQISFNKSSFRPTASKQVSALSSSTAYNASLSQSTASTSILKLNEKSSKMPIAIPTKDKTKPSLKAPVDEEHVQPSQIIQTQMAARAKAAMQIEPLVPSESIELPEVNSEYSDSDDERTFDPPGWAQSPELRQALEAQSTINPDDIFGEIRPLRMEEFFKAKASRFRARSSSANWSGADRLTAEEEREYARRMGFK